MNETVKKQIIEEMKKYIYNNLNYYNYINEAGWQDWMNDYLTPEQQAKETLTDLDLEEINNIQLIIWSEAFQMVADEIDQGRKEKK